MSTASASATATDDTRTDETRADATSAEPGVTTAAITTSLLRPLSLVGGVAMLATPLLIVAGLITSPPQASRAQADYIESLARDPLLTSVSASLLHYGWVTMALGLVVAITLVGGRRGRVLTMIGGVAGGFVAVQMSALMLNDYYLAAFGNNLPMADAVRVADAVMLNGDLLSTFWWKCATGALVLPVLLYLGLARARVIPWWTTPLSLFPMIAPFLVMGLFSAGGDQLIGASPLGLVAGAVVGLVCYLPTVLVGLRLLAQGRRRTS